MSSHDNPSNNGENPRPWTEEDLTWELIDIAYQRGFRDGIRQAQSSGEYVSSDINPEYAPKVISGDK